MTAGQEPMMDRDPAGATAPVGAGPGASATAEARDRDRTRDRDRDAEIAALRAEAEELRRRLRLQEQIGQIRDAAFPRGTAGLAPGGALPRRVEFDARDGLAAEDGIYGLEFGDRGGFRWTGPAAETRFRAWIDRSVALRVTLDLYLWGDPANRGGLTVQVDDGPPLPLVETETEGRLAAWPVPPRAEPGPTEIRLRVPHLHIPRERSGGASADSRRLGIAFLRLILGPG